MTRERNANEAERLKQERAQHEEMISVQKRQEEMKAMSMKQMIRNQKQEQVEQRAMEQQQKRLAQRQELINKINLENERRFQIEVSRSPLWLLHCPYRLITHVFVYRLRWPAWRLKKLSGSKNCRTHRRSRQLHTMSLKMLSMGNNADIHIHLSTVFHFQT